MSDQGKVLITFAIPASTARGVCISGAGTISATLAGFALVYEGTDAVETRGQVQIQGIGEAISAATIAAGIELKPDASGHMVAATVGTDHVFGISLEASVDGDLFRVKIL